MTRDETIQSMWSRIQVLGLDDCWEWTGHVSIYGYGTDSSAYLEFGTNRVHRVVYYLTHGEISNKLQVLHSCDNRKCCNPLHLRLGTHQENMWDMTDRNRQSHYGVSQPGETNGSHKLTLAQVKAILQDDRTLKLISMDYNVSKVRVSQIKRRKAWRNI